MARKLVTVQRVIDKSPIEGADAIEKIKVLGWQLVAKKNEFRVGDLCVYFEIDSFLPVLPAFEFLRKSSFRKLDDGSEGFRLRTIKLRGVVSQGLALPLTEIKPENGLGEIRQNTLYPSNNSGVIELSEGVELTDAFGVTKYEPPIPANLAGIAIGNTPSWIMTDETRVQVLQDLLDAYNGTVCYVTEKLDGSSFTAFLDEEKKLHVCSRKLDLLRDAESNSMWKWAVVNRVEEKLRALDFRACIQGEIFGEGIQGNPYNQRGQAVRFFNVLDMDKREALSFVDFKRVLAILEFESVPILDTNFVLHNNIEQLVEMARGKSILNDKQHREGFVIRPLQATMDARFDVPHSRVSLKVINPDFLLSGGD
jgi:RNA ligase (TIGR02306 family)